MALFWLCLILSVVGSNAAGDITILHSPTSLQFTGKTKTPASLLKEVYSASLGLSVEENSDWDGLKITDPFNTPEAVVEIYVDGVTPRFGLGRYRKLPVFPLTVDEYEPDTFEILKHRIKQRFTNGGNNLVKIDFADIDQVSSQNDVFGEIVRPKKPYPIPPSLNISYGYKEINDYFFEVESLKSIVSQVESITPDSKLDFYSFRVRSFHALNDIYSPGGAQITLATRLMADEISRLNTAFKKAYKKSVLVVLIETDEVHTRRAIRSVEDENKKETKDEESVHLDDKYSSDYSAIFNIILWFGVIFTFTLVAIVYAIMDMDPGRDSIIYRMTSTRMKKDN